MLGLFDLVNGEINGLERLFLVFRAAIVSVLELFARFAQMLQGTLKAPLFGEDRGGAEKENGEEEEGL